MFLCIEGQRIVRTTLDIPDPIYRDIKIRAAIEGVTIREVVLDGIEMRLARRQTALSRSFQVPVVRSKHPGTLNLTNEQIDELTAFS